MDEAQTIRYQDCILGKVGTPKEKKQKILFQFMVMSCSVPLTVTFNWFIHTPEVTWEQFVAASYLYPLTFLLAACVRCLIANPIVDRMVRAFIAPQLKGMKKSLSITALNVLVMGTTIALLRVVIVQGGFEGIFWLGYFTTLPISWAMSFVLSYFFLSPFIKKLFVSKIAPRIEAYNKIQAAQNKEKSSKMAEPFNLRYTRSLQHEYQNAMTKTALRVMMPQEKDLEGWKGLAACAMIHFNSSETKRRSGCLGRKTQLPAEKLLDAVV